MISKQEVLGSMKDEIKIVKHLVSKIKEEHLSYKPSEKQRTMLELLQYISYCGLVGTSFTVTGNWDAYKQIAEDGAKVTLSGMPVAMDSQMVKIEALLKNLNDKDLSELDAKTPWGASQKAGLGLVNTALKFLVGYRMQLFLYMKDAGIPNLGTSNCWMGADPTPPAAK
jgi:hypothetical protein